MSTKETATTTIIALIVGVLGISAVAYYGGFLTWDTSGARRTKPVSATPDMDMLNAYQSRKAKTKHIILDTWQQRRRVFFGRE